MSIMAAFRVRRRRFVPRRTDENQRAIVAALARAGFLVHDLSGAGGGVPDLLVGRKGDGRLVLLEVKRPFVSGQQMRRKDVKLRASQVDFHRLWAGFPVFVVASPEEAVAKARDFRRDEVGS